MQKCHLGVKSYSDVMVGEAEAMLAILTHFMKTANFEASDNDGT
jgi:hypothetical protein